MSTTGSLDQLRAELETRGIELGPEIGAGATATVYAGDDRRHSRRVAIKVLDPRGELSRPIERFAGEIAVVAQLTHPHIVPLYDSGEVGGVRYYIMPLATGETLRERLQDGPLPADEAVRLAIEVADALRYAHERGVIHRDIKPGNILLESGHALVSDFGLADELVAAVPGGFVGTLEYMAPEQLFGEAVDARTDIYALGCTLYEMLSGALPFGGSTPEQLARAKLLGRPLALERQVPGLPEGLADVVDAALASEPRARIGSAAELIERLQRFAGSGIYPVRPRHRARVLAVGILVLTVGLLVAGDWWWRAGAKALDPHRVTIASFTNETGSAALEPFGDELTDRIAEGLSRAGKVDVITSAVDVPVARSADTAAAESPPERVASLARETHAGTVVAGSYYLMGQTLEVDVEITNTRSGDLEAAIGPVTADANAQDSLGGQVQHQVVAAVDSLVAAGRIGLMGR